MSTWLALALLASFTFSAVGQMLLLLQPGELYGRPQSRRTVWTDVAINVGFGLWVFYEWMAK